jgi:hypothetical protein
MHTSKLARRALLLLTLVLPFADAHATTILPNCCEPDVAGDWNLLPPSASGHEGILGYLYGWSNLTRIDDLDDQRWSFGPGAEARARAAFSGSPYDFGWLDTSSNYHNILSYPYRGLMGYLDLPWVPFASSDSMNRFALRSIAGQFDSARNQDPMVTFQITGNANQYGNDYSANIIGNYLLAWEDLPFSISDRDYNDFVLELHGVSPTMEPLPVIPEPATVLLLGSGLAAMAAHGRRGRR